MVVEMNGTNVTVNNRTEGIVFFGMVQVCPFHGNKINLFVFQGISQLVDPSRMIGYSQARMACTPNIVFTNDSFEVTLPDADSKETFTMCVQLTLGDCMEMASRDFICESSFFMSCCIFTGSPTQFPVEPPLHKMEE